MQNSGELFSIHRTAQDTFTHVCINSFYALTATTPVIKALWSLLLLSSVFLQHGLTAVLSHFELMTPSPPPFNLFFFEPHFLSISLYHYTWASIRALRQAAGQSPVPAGNRPSASHASPAGVPTHAEPVRRHTHSHLISQQQHYPQGLTSMMPACHVQSHFTHRARDNDCNLDIKTGLESFLVFPASHIVLHCPGRLAVTWPPDQIAPIFLALTHDHLLFISICVWYIFFAY